MKQNKNLLSSRLTENRMNDQNIQSKPDSAIQEKSNPVLEKKLNKIFDKGKKEEEPAYFQYADSSNLTDQNLEDYAEIQDNTKMKRGNLHTKIIMSRKEETLTYKQNMSKTEVFHVIKAIGCPLIVFGLGIFSYYSELGRV